MAQPTPIQMKAMKIEGPTIVYIYDALCGWCYGFSPVMQQLQHTYADRFDFRVISGGMITGERIGPIGEVAPYIKWAYKEVEEKCGVKFGEGFLRGVLEEGSTVFTSIPPAIAMAVFESYQPRQTVAFASALQRAIYYDGIDPNAFSAYGPHAAEFGIDADEFVAKMGAPGFLEAAQRDFQTAAQIGVSGFPTLFLYDGRQWHLLARGYAPYMGIRRRVDKILATTSVE